MDFFELFWVPVDVKTAKNLADVIDDIWFIVNQMNDTFLDCMKVKSLGGSLSLFILGKMGLLRMLCLICFVFDILSLGLNLRNEVRG